MELSTTSNSAGYLLLYLAEKLTLILPSTEKQRWMGLDLDLDI